MKAERKQISNWLQQARKDNQNKEVQLDNMRLTMELDKVKKTFTRWSVKQNWENMVVSSAAWYKKPFLRLKFIFNQKAIYKKIMDLRNKEQEKPPEIVKRPATKEEVKKSNIEVVKR